VHACARVCWQFIAEYLRAYIYHSESESQLTAIPMPSPYLSPSLRPLPPACAVRGPVLCRVGPSRIPRVRVCARVLVCRQPPTDSSRTRIKYTPARRNWGQSTTINQHSYRESHNTHGHKQGRSRIPPAASHTHIARHMGSIYKQTCVAKRHGLGAWGLGSVCENMRMRMRTNRASVSLLRESLNTCTHSLFSVHKLCNILALA